MGLLRAYMHHRITVFHPTGRDTRGNPTGTTIEEVRAKITFVERMIRGPDGTDKKSMANVETEHPVEVGDTITLPDGRKQQVIQRHIHSGLLGREDHREVYL